MVQLNWGLVVLQKHPVEHSIVNLIMFLEDSIENALIVGVLRFLVKFKGERVV